MQKFLPLIMGLFYCSPLAAQEISYPEKDIKQSSFILSIQNIPKNEGEIRIAVFDNEKDYNDKQNPVHAVVLPVHGKTLSWSDENLPHGTYAIAVYHDKNVNGELDANLLGIPKEAYGFSNNARGRFGPASWEDAHFEVNSDHSGMNIAIK